MNRLCSRCKIESLLTSKIFQLEILGFSRTKSGKLAKEKRKSRVGKKVKDKREKFCPVPTNSATHNTTLRVYLVCSTFLLVPFTQSYWGNPLPFQSYDIVNLRHLPTPFAKNLERDNCFFCCTNTFDKMNDSTKCQFFQS